MHLVRPILLQVFFSDVCQTPWPLGSRHYRGQTGEQIWNPGGVEFLQNKMECGRHERLHLTGKDDDVMMVVVTAVMMTYPSQTMAGSIAV